jgi:hypothetical protein
MNRVNMVNLVNFAADPCEVTLCTSLEHSVLTEKLLKYMDLAGSEGSRLTLRQIPDEVHHVHQVHRGPMRRGSFPATPSPASLTATVRSQTLNQIHNLHPERVGNDL